MTGKKRGRPRVIDDDMVRTLVAKGVDKKTIAEALHVHPKSVGKALARASGKKTPTVGEIKKALEAFRDAKGHFAQCLKKCDPACRALRAALGEETE